MDPVEIEKSQIENDPYILWNTFLEISGSHPDKLTDIQRTGHFVLRYYGEVNNGGHHQFFANANQHDADVRSLVTSTLAALTELCADDHKSILQRAAGAYLSEWKTDDEDDLGPFDDEFFDCFPDIHFYLEAFVRLHQDAFVKIID